MLKTRSSTTRTLVMMAVMALFAVVFSPLSNVHAEKMINPYATMKITKVSDGSGHGTPAQTFITSKNGYSPADDTPTDGVVASGDTVHYDVQIDILPGPARNVQFDISIPEWLEYDASDNPNLFPANNFADIVSNSYANGKVTGIYRAKRGVGVTIKVPLVLTAKDSQGDVKDAQIVKAEVSRSGSQPYSTSSAAGVTVVSAPQADLVVSSSRYPIYSTSSSASVYLTPKKITRKGDSAKGSSNETEYSGTLHVDGLDDGVHVAYTDIDGAHTKTLGTDTMSFRAQGPMTVSIMRPSEHWGLDEGAVKDFNVWVTLDKGSFSSEGYENNSEGAQPGDNMSKDDSTAGWAGSIGRATTATEGYYYPNNDYTKISIYHKKVEKGAIFGKENYRPSTRGVTVFDDEAKTFGTPVYVYPDYQDDNRRVAEGTENQSVLRIESQNIESVSSATISDQWNVDQNVAQGKVVVKDPNGNELAPRNDVAPYTVEWYVGFDAPRTVISDSGVPSTEGWNSQLADPTKKAGWLAVPSAPENAKAVRVIFSKLPTGKAPQAGSYSATVSFKTVADYSKWQTLPATFADRAYGYVGSVSENFLQRYYIPVKPDIPTGSLKVVAHTAVGVGKKEVQWSHPWAEYEFSPIVYDLPTVKKAVPVKVDITLDSHVLSVDEDVLQSSGWSIVPGSLELGDPHTGKAGHVTVRRDWTANNYNDHKTELPKFIIRGDVSALASGSVPVSGTFALEGLEGQGRTYDASDDVHAGQLSILSAFVQAETPKVEVGDTLEWSTFVSAQTQGGVQSAETVFLLPNKGHEDGNLDGIDLGVYDGSHESSYHGSYTVENVTVDTNNSSTGVTLMYTTDENPSMERGQGNWTETFSPNITGFKVVHPVGDTSVSKVTYSLKPTGNEPDDVYVSWISPVYAQDGTDSIKSYPVEEKVVASQITGYVFWDTNEHGSDRTADSRGIENVSVELLNKSGNVIHATQTDSTGFYSFERDSHSGDYSVRVAGGVPTHVDSQFVHGKSLDVQQTFSYRYKRGTLANTVSDTVNLGVDEVFDNVNFGYFAKDPFITLDKQPAQISCDENGVCDVEYQVTVENKGNTPQTGIQFVENTDSKMFDTQVQYGTLDKKNVKKVVQVVAGSHSFALTDTGEVYATGFNSYGQLGLGDTSDRNVFTKVDGLPKVVQVVAGSSHSFALTDTGEVYATGRNSYGQLGLGDTSDRNVFTKVDGLPKVTQVVAGSYHSLALTDTGEVYATGRNSYGRLGLGDTSNRQVFTKVNGLPKVVQVVAGSSHSLALTDTGEVYATGSNSSGELGLGDMRNRQVFTKVHWLPKVTQVVAGDSHSLALTDTGEVYATGYNVYGELGLGDTSNRKVFTHVDGLPKVVQVVAGGSHSLALTDTGEVYATGRNSSGQLGLTDASERNVFTKVDGLPKVAQVVAGYFHSLALTDTGEVYATGSNDYGRLGLGDTSNRQVFTQVTEPFITTIPGQKGVFLTLDKISGSEITYSLEDMPVSTDVQPARYDIVVSGKVLQKDVDQVVTNQAWVTSKENPRMKPVDPTPPAFDNDKPNKAGHIDGNDTCNVGESTEDQCGQVFNQIPQVDMSTFPTGAISGNIWLDFDKNGVMDLAGREETIKGVSVSLLKDGAPYGTAITDENGHYSFERLPAGSYEVSFSDPVTGFTTTSERHIASTWGLTTQVDSYTENKMSGISRERMSGVITISNNAQENVNLGVVEYAPKVNVGKFWTDADGGHHSYIGASDKDTVSVVFNSHGHNDTDYFVHVVGAGKDVPLVRVEDTDVYQATVTPTHGDTVSFVVYGGTLAGNAQVQHVDNVAVNNQVTVTYDNLQANGALPQGAIIPAANYVTANPDDGVAKDKSVTIDINIPLTNNGDEPLTKFVLEDTTLSGATMEWVSCPADELTALVLQPGQIHECLGRLTIPDPQHHTDKVTVTATGITTGATVTSNARFDVVTIAEELPKPSISVEKGVLDTETDTIKHNVPDIAPWVETPLTFRVTNTGEDDLTQITLIDYVNDGHATVSAIVCDIPEETVGGVPTKVLRAGKSVDCTATLSGLDPLTTHGDQVTVYGVGLHSQKPVTDKSTFTTNSTVKHVDISLELVDNENVSLNGGEFTFVNNNGTETRNDVLSKGADVHTWNINRVAPGSYTVRQTTVPENYLGLPETFTVNVDDDGNVSVAGLPDTWVKAEGSKVTVINYPHGTVPLPLTGTHTSLVVISVVLLLVLVGAFATVRYGRKENS